jgi:excisionase family DNA binding protein
MNTVQISNLEQVPGAINLIFKRFDELQAQINSKPTVQPTAPPPDELLTRKQAAAALKVSLPTLNELTKAGTLKGYRVTGSNRLRYKASEVNNALTVIKPANLSA